MHFVAYETLSLVKSIFFFSDMRCLVTFVTAVCFLFLLKLKWPKNKSVYLEPAKNVYVELRFLAWLNLYITYNNNNNFIGTLN